MAKRKLQLNVLQSFTFVHSCDHFFLKVLKIAALFSVSYILCFNLRPNTLSIHQTCWNSHLDQPIWWFTHISMKICQYSLTLVSFQNFFLLWSTKVNFWRISRPLFSTHSKWIKTRPVKLRKDTKEPQKYKYSSFYVFWSHATYWNLKQVQTCDWIIHWFSLRSIEKGSSLCPNPFKGFTLRSESFEGLKGVGHQMTVSLSALLLHCVHTEAPSSCSESAQRIMWNP